MKTLGLSAIAGILLFFTSVGSIGVYLNFNDKNWEAIGVHPDELRRVIRNFPEERCQKEYRVICKELSDKVSWFLGL